MQSTVLLGISGRGLLALGGGRACSGPYPNLVDALLALMGAASEHGPLMAQPPQDSATQQSAFDSFNVSQQNSLEGTSD